MPISNVKDKDPIPGTRNRILKSQFFRVFYYKDSSFKKELLAFGGRSMTTWARRSGRWSKKCLFLSMFRVKNVQVEESGGQKRAKLCPRSH